MKQKEIWALNSLASLEITLPGSSKKFERIKLVTTKNALS